MVPYGTTLEPNLGPVGCTLERINYNLNDTGRKLNRLRRVLEITDHSSAACALMAPVKQPSELEVQWALCSTAYSGLKSEYDSTSEPSFLYRLFGRTHKVAEDVNSLVDQCLELGYDVDQTTAQVARNFLMPPDEDKYELDAQTFPIKTLPVVVSSNSKSPVSKTMFKQPISAFLLPGLVGVDPSRRIQGVMHAVGTSHNPQHRPFGWTDDLGERVGGLVERCREFGTLVNRNLALLSGIDDFLPPDENDFLPPDENDYMDTVD